MIRRCPVCGLDVHDRRNSGRLRPHNGRDGLRCSGSEMDLMEVAAADYPDPPASTDEDGRNDRDRHAGSGEEP